MCEYIVRVTQTPLEWRPTVGRSTTKTWIQVSRDRRYPPLREKQSEGGTSSRVIWTPWFCVPPWRHDPEGGHHSLTRGGHPVWSPPLEWSPQEGVPPSWGVPYGGCPLGHGPGCRLDPGLYPAAWAMPSGPCQGGTLVGPPSLLPFRVVPSVRPGSSSLLLWF